MTCPTCTLLRAQLDDAERHADTLQQRLAELTGGDPDPIMVATSATIAKLRATVARLIPRWRAGEPPAGVWVWRQAKVVHGDWGDPRPVWTFTHPKTGALMWGHPSDPNRWDGSTEVRWCLISKPEES